MKVRCPHCHEVFASEDGGIQECPRCGRRIDIPDPAPGEPVGPEPSTGPEADRERASGDSPPSGIPLPEGLGAAGIPWEHRDEVGWLSGFGLTWKEIFLHPLSFWERMRPDGAWTDALLFAWIVYAIQALVRLPLSFASTRANPKLMAMVLQQLGTQQNAEAQRWMSRFVHTASGEAILFEFLIGALAFPLLLIVGAGILHLFCVLFSCARSGYWSTLRVMAYSTAPWIFAFLPCVGIVAGIYMIVLEINGLARIHDSTTGRAAGAVLTPFVLSFACCCVGVLALALGAGAFIQGMH